MAAVTGAMAQATIYGIIDQAYSTSKTTVGSTQTSQKTNLGAYQMGQSLLGVKGSEDMGNGMKASYLYEFGLATDTSATPTNRQSYVGLSGGFGALRVGKQYSSAFNNSVAADPLGATGGAGGIYLAILTSNDSTSEFPLRQDKAIQYDLPTMVPGLTATITKVFGNNNSAAANSLSTTADGQKTGDGTGFALTYTSGALYAGFTTDSVVNTGVVFGTNDDSTATTDATANTVIAASTLNKNKINTTTLTYDFGAAKVGYNTAKVTVGAQSANTTMYSIAAPMGAVTLVLNTSTGKIDLTGTSSDMKLKGQQYGVNYALSKRTTAYWHNGNHTITTTSTGVAKKVTGYGIGLMHAF